MLQKFNVTMMYYTNSLANSEWNMKIAFKNNEISNYISMKI